MGQWTPYPQNYFLLTPSLRPAYANLRRLMFLNKTNISLRGSLREPYANPTRTDVFEKHYLFWNAYAKLTPSLREPTRTDVFEKRYFV